MHLDKDANVCGEQNANVIVVLRLGKPVDFIQTIFRNLILAQDSVIKVCAIGRSTFFASWLLLDMVQWVGVGGFCQHHSILVVSCSKCFSRRSKYQVDQHQCFSLLALRIVIFLFVRSLSTSQQCFALGDCLEMLGQRHHRWRWSRRDA